MPAILITVIRFTKFVSCRNETTQSTLWKCTKSTDSTNSTNSTDNTDKSDKSDKSDNDNLYVRTKDIINIRSVTELKLRSHNITFNIDNEVYQEVAVHNERIGGIDEVWLKSNLYF